jgi:hypothetical protein
MERRGTKHKVTSYYDMQSHMTSAEQLLKHFNSKCQLNPLLSLSNLVEKIGRSSECIHKQEKHVYEIMYFVLSYLYTYVDALAYGLRFYTEYPYALFTKYSPRIQPNLVKLNEPFIDIHEPNICLQIDTMLPVIYRDEDNGTSRAARYLCFVKLDTRKHGASIVFSQGIKKSKT